MVDFEIAIFNADVRACVEAGDRHRDLKDEWADIHYFDIKAANAVEARAKISRRYPAEKGYVIENIAEVRTD
ncbi:MAG: hypothetical protein HQ503_11905 [Rhodospirillales bacterium]|nr:hypothetical protein [Rhodospirillales bacterium]